jgi:hypothetical protein
MRNNGAVQNFTAPQNFQASHGKKGAIEFSWTPVQGAIRYLVYRSDNPIQGFTFCGETLGEGGYYTLSVPAGTGFYFKIEAANAKNEKTPMSGAVFGTSLARPVISDIREEPGAIQVYWYMHNLEDYKDQVRYVVSCYREGTSTPDRFVELDGSALTDTFVEFEELQAKTAYFFQVEAFRPDAADQKEVSDRMNIDTIQKLIPAKPSNPRTVGGGEKQSITLSFELPQMVDVKAGETDPHPLYFVISRREAGTGGTFLAVCSYFGSDAVKAGGTAHFSYVQGDTVSWTDSILEAQRGIKYEYRIQSYTDGIDTVVTSSGSMAFVTGWAMKEPAVGFGVPVYTGNGSSFTSAVLPLEFTHDNMAVEYDYILRETIEPIGDGDPNDAAGSVTREEGPLGLAQMQAYAVSIDLTAKTGPGQRGRGKYSYAVDVRLKGGSMVIETVHTVGSQRIFEKNLAHLNIENFTVRDGYTDKFVLAWKKKAGLDYQPAWAPAANGPWTDLPDVPAGSADDNFTYPVTGQSAGTSRYFSVYAMEGALDGETAYSPEAQTLGTPVPVLDPALSYDAVTLIWPPVQKADYYQVHYRYAGESTFLKTGLIPLGSLSQSAGQYRYSLKPEGSAGIDAAKAGKPVEIKVEALNEARRASDGSGTPISTVSNTVSNARLFGPAGLEQPGAITASQIASVAEIELSWNEVAGAPGYYVIRRQYDTGNADPRGAPVLFYVNAQTRTLTGKDVAVDGMGIPEDSANVSAELDFAGGKYTLKDQAMADDVYQAKKAGFGRYADEQNEMLWGLPYRYWIIPVLKEGDRPVINGDGTCSVGGVSYSAASTKDLEKTGRTLGFVTDVRATKGTWSSDGGTTNDGVKVTWNKPARIPDSKSPSYYVFRKREAIAADPWIPLTASPTTALFYENKAGDGNPPADGTAYEYVVGISLDGMVSHPEENARFVTELRTGMDDTYAAERRMSGFVLPRPTMISASKTANSDADGYYEVVEWNAAGVDSLSSVRKNRGVTGYAIEVRDQSNAGNWRVIKTVEVPAGQDPADFTEKLYNTNGLLNVLRDYHHYYRIRAYAVDEVYSPPPDMAAISLDGSENDYIKWGARPINATEFAGLTSLAIGKALADKGGTYEGNIISAKNYDTSLTGAKPFFLTINGTIRVNAAAFYGSITKYGNNTLTFSLAAGDVDFDYSGSVTITDLTSSGGTYSVTFGGTTVSVDRKYISKPFTFGSKNMQNCDGFYEWSESSGWQ